MMYEQINIIINLHDKINYFHSTNKIGPLKL